MGIRDGNGMVQHIIIICYAGLLAVMTACSSHALHDAQDIVAEADCIWAAGQMYNDSAQLAQAYRTLEEWKAIYPDEFLHSCYHYGRLLRKREDPVSAMQVFINATHSRTHDYHFLGRVYSNMGDIAHSAGEYSLSYDMYECSAEMYITNGDSLLYYYDLNNMAFELAEQGKKEETLSLIRRIENNCPFEKPVTESLRSKATLYRNIGQYDSVLCVIDALHNSGSIHPSGYVIKAQALWFSGKKDSALLYAKHIMTLPDICEQDQYNMLYIILNEDSTLDVDEIKTLSDQRADLELKRLVPLHKQYAVATNLLRQDLDRKPRYYYVIPICIIFIILILSLYLYAQKIHKEKTKQQKLLLTVQQQQSSHIQYKQQEIERVCSTIRKESDWQKKIYWKDYDLLCDFIDKHFFFFTQKLKEWQTLNEKEIRLCILVLIGGFSDKQMADILCYGEKSIRGIKRHTAQKLGTNSANLHNFLLNMILGK